MNKFKDFFKNELVNILARKISKSVQQSLNRGVDSNKLLRPLGDGSDVLFNCTLTQDPILRDDYLAMPFDGSFVANKGEEMVGKQPDIELPIYSEGGKQI